MALGSADTWQHLASRLQKGVVCTDLSSRQRFALGSLLPQAVIWPANEEEVATTVELCAEDGVALVAWGAGARQRQLPPPWRYDVALVLSRLNRVVAYEPDDLTITVESGCRWDVLGGLLAPRRLWIPFDVAVPCQSTVGGVVASAAVGWERAGQLCTRDLLLGVAWVTGHGQLVHGGGRVVKNVAGYDLMRLLAGSWGTLGVLTQVTWKLLPAPQERAIGWVGSRSLVHALQLAMACQEQQPLPTSLAAVAFSPSAGVAEAWRVGVVAGYSGTPEEVRAGKAILEAKFGDACWLPEADAAADLVRHVRDFSLVGPAQPWAAGLRLSLLASDLMTCAEALGTVVDKAQASVCIWPQRGTVLVRFGEQTPRTSCLRTWLWANEFAREHRGWAWPELWPERWEFESVSLPHLYLSRRVKEVLDPMGILSPGRYWRHW